MESTAEELAAFKLQRTRDIMREVNAQHLAETGHVMWVATKFDKQGEPLEYQTWEHHQAERAASGD